MTNELKWLQQWYSEHCDGAWEHGFGITIETIDNPGWARLQKGHDLLEKEYGVSLMNENYFAAMAVKYPACRITSSICWLDHGIPFVALWEQRHWDSLRPS